IMNKKSSYIKITKMIDQSKYKIENSKDDIMRYFKENHPHLTGLCRFLISAFESNPNSVVWTTVYKVAVHLTTKLSNKINFKNQDYEILNERNIKAILPMKLT